MPKITEYSVPSAQAKLRPSPDAEAAFETAARRIGPLMNQAGQDYREMGRVQAASIRAQDFPLNFAAFAQDRPGAGFNFKVQGGAGGFTGGRGGGSGGGRGAASSASGYGRGGRGQNGDPVGHAAGLAQLWSGNTPTLGGDPVSVLHGDRYASSQPSIITPNPLAPVDKGLNNPDVQPFASHDTSLPPPGYLQDQVDKYGVAPPQKLDAPEGYSSASSSSGSGFWSGLVEGVSNAISSVGGSTDYSATGGETP